MKNISTVTRDLDVTRKLDLDNVSSTITTKLASKLTVYPLSSYNANTCYNEGVYLISAGSNCPSGSSFGSLFVMPYRKATGNTQPDFCTQIYMPNGDDSSKPYSMFYRTSLKSGWNSWQEVVTLAVNQTITGIKTFSDYIKTPQVANTSGKALVRYKDTEVKSVFGNDSSASVLMGNTTRPYYSNSGSDFTGNEIALYSDLTNKLTTSNIIAGSNITLTTSGNNVTINAETGEGGTNVYVSGGKVAAVNFDSDPQTQINKKMDSMDPTGTGSFSLNRKAGTTVGNMSVAIGSDTTASGDWSHAESASTTASGNCAHAEGSLTTASGYASHAEGDSTIASGDCSHAEGQRTTASGFCSHAEGSDTIASGDFSHVEGRDTKASGSYSHVFGKYNIEDTNSTCVEIVGNGGGSTVRSNARTLDWSGNEWLAGKITPSGGLSDGNNDTYALKIPDTTSWTADKTIATIDELNSAITNLQTQINNMLNGTTTFTKVTAKIVDLVD